MTLTNEEYWSKAKELATSTNGNFDWAEVVKIFQSLKNNDPNIDSMSLSVSDQSSISHLYDSLNLYKDSFDTSFNNLVHSMEKIKELYSKINEYTTLRDDKTLIPMSFDKDLDSIEALDSVLSTFDTFNFYFEKDYNGYRVFCFYFDGSARILNDNGEDISRLFPELIDSLKHFSEVNFILDAQIVYDLDISNHSLSTVTSYIDYLGKKGHTPNDSDFCLYLYDVVYLKQDISKEPLSTRKAKLKTFRYNSKIKLNPFVEVTDMSTAKKGAQLFSSMLGSFGCLIRKMDSIYHFGKKSSNWIRYHKSDVSEQ